MVREARGFHVGRLSYQQYGTALDVGPHQRCIGPCQCFWLLLSDTGLTLL